MTPMDYRPAEQRERGGLAAVIGAVAGRLTSAALDLSNTKMDLLLAQDSRDARILLEVTARGDEPEIGELQADLKRLKQDLFEVAERWRKREFELRAACEQEFGEAPYYAEPFIGREPRYSDDVYTTMRLFLGSETGASADSDAAAEEWYEHGRFLANALRYTLDRLRRYDALSAVAHDRRPPFTGHALEWRGDAGRWHLGGRPLHAGDPVRLLSDYHGWLPGRCESGNGGRRVYFVFRLADGGDDLSVALGDEHRLAWPSECGR